MSISKESSFDLDVFRGQLGVEDTEYKAMSDFKKRVLDLAVKEINEKSKLNSKISRLNFDLDNIIYTSSKNYNSNLSNQINDKLYEVNSLMVQNKVIDKNIFNSLNQNIDKLLNTIIYFFNDDKYLKLKPYKTNKSDILYKINKYNEINDIIKTLEVMN